MKYLIIILFLFAGCSSTTTQHHYRKRSQNTVLGIVNDLFHSDVHPVNPDKCQPKHPGAERWNKMVMFKSKL